MKNLFFSLSILSILVLQSCIRDNEDPVAVAPFEGKIDSANVGGGAQPNQVWYDLSSGEKILNNRTDWDLGFYSGDSFKVILNSSIMMAAGKIDNATNIDAVTAASVATLMTKVQVANFDPNNEQYIDDVKGDVVNGHTAIATISAKDSDNAIYLVNMGKKIYVGDIPVGSTYTGGDARGWMKVQITRNGQGYKIKYADINATTHKEYNIQKNTSYNFSFFSMVNHQEIIIQPEKDKWDLGFTVFTNVIAGAGSYIYADFVLDNILGGVGAYQVNIPTGVSGSTYYNSFTVNDVDASKLIYNDQRTIGASWRNPIGANGLEVYSDRFYVIKDSEGLFYKLRFNRMTSLSGERGHPQFEYQPL